MRYTEEELIDVFIKAREELESKKLPRNLRVYYQGEIYKVNSDCFKIKVTKEKI